MGFISQRAFLGSAATKTALVTQLTAQQTTATANVASLGDDARGAAIWWLLRDPDSRLAESTFGIPVRLVHLIEHIFQMLPLASALTFPLAAVNAITPGADLNPVYSRFAVWSLNDATSGMLQFADTATAAVIANLVTLHGVPTPPGDPAWLPVFKAAQAALNDARGRGSSRIVKTVAEHAGAAADAGVGWGVAAPPAKRAQLLTLLAAAT